MHKTVSTVVPSELNVVSTIFQILQRFKFLHLA